MFIQQNKMPFNYPVALKSIGASQLTPSGTYTGEMIFLQGAFNVFCCMGGPHYNPGTTKILDTIFDQDPKEAITLLYLAKKINLSHLDKRIDYIFFWDLFKKSNEELNEFMHSLANYPIDESIDWSDYIPESIQKVFE
jgi:hypothetical protein